MSSNILVLVNSDSDWVYFFPPCFVEQRSMNTSTMLDYIFHALRYSTPLNQNLNTTNTNHETTIHRIPSRRLENPLNITRQSHNTATHTHRVHTAMHNTPAFYTACPMMSSTAKSTDCPWSMDKCPIKLSIVKADSLPIADWGLRFLLRLTLTHLIYRVMK